LSRFISDRFTGYVLTIVVSLSVALFVGLINLGDMFRIIKKET